jgi:hypothetical protein
VLEAMGDAGREVYQVYVCLLIRPWAGDGQADREDAGRMNFKEFLFSILKKGTAYKTISFLKGIAVVLKAY